MQNGYQLYFLFFISCVFVAGFMRQYMHSAVEAFKSERRQMDEQTRKLIEATCINTDIVIGELCDSIEKCREHDNGQFKQYQDSQTIALSGLRNSLWALTVAMQKLYNDKGEPCPLTARLTSDKPASEENAP